MERTPLIEPASWADSYNRDTLDGRTLALVVRLGGLFRVSVNDELVPAQMTAPVVRHMLQHDEFTVTCTVDHCWQARIWVAAWPQPPQEAQRALRVVDTAS